MAAENEYANVAIKAATNSNKKKSPVELYIAAYHDGTPGTGQQHSLNRRAVPSGIWTMRKKVPANNAA